jgi:hypothetical protein
LLALPVLAVVAIAHRYMHLYAPTNRLVLRVKTTRPSAARGSWLVLLAASLLAGGHLAATAVAEGASGWLNLLVLVLFWDAIKVAALAISETFRALRAGSVARTDVSYLSATATKGR